MQSISNALSTPLLRTRWLTMARTQQHHASSRRKQQAQAPSSVSFREQGIDWFSVMSWYIL
jgi:hypothetical protein